MSADDKIKKNRLSNETSPYLLQHSANPVDWYPWGKEALEKAVKEDKPILLSVGYSACHWCHVMAHESFEDTVIADIMNDLFINIKVDREERPDLDRIYQSAHHLLTGRAGGWPLTMFLTPGTLVPFFGGTYFPAEPSHGLPSFSDVLQSVDDIFRQRREEVEAQNVKLVEFLKQAEQPVKGSDGAVLDASPLMKASRDLAGAFDDVNGGFGSAPKFPMPSSLERLLRGWAASFRDGKVDGGALEMTRFALESMALGGIYDHLGGGFFRYSVDERWEIPHFEKMLYDNGLLLSLYSDAWLATGEPLFRRVAEETAGWVMREMQPPEGGYLSSLDADSGGVEGSFYAWDRGEVEKILGKDEYPSFALHFGLDLPANFEGKWHLHVNMTADDMAEQMSMAEDEFTAAINKSRKKLFDAREKRIRPGIDDKVLASWNGLMLKGMARAGRMLGRADFVESAERALGFIRGHMFDDDRLFATHAGGRARHAGYLDDYAFMLDGALELLQARWNAEDMEFAVLLADALLEHFQDDANGGFFFTAHDHEKLIFRPQPVADDALPSGNGVAALALARLGHILGETRYTDAAERTLKSTWASIENAPSSYTTLLTALEEHLSPPQVAVIRGSGNELEKWQLRCSSRYAPGRITLAIPDNAGGLPGILSGRKPSKGAVAYVCSGTVCHAPVTSYGEFEKELEPFETPQAEAR